ncbi:MAG: DUF5335 family protein [Bacillota bacterium]
MSKTQIPQEQWASFFNNFNAQNQNKIVKIEITDDEDYRIDYAESLPFKEVKITSQNDAGISVSVSAGASNSFLHTIDKTLIVILEEVEEKIKALQIRSALGRTAVIRFHPLTKDDDLM